MLTLRYIKITAREPISTHLGTDEALETMVESSEESWFQLLLDTANIKIVRHSDSVSNSAINALNSFENQPLVYLSE